MGYKLYDEKGNEVTPSNLQNKGAWCAHGERKEEVFVRLHGDDLNVIINPAKEENRYAPDLAYPDTEDLADLKTQNSPFFQAQSRFDLDPQYTIVFNGNDRRRYRQQHPQLDIYFWVDWTAVRFEGSRGNTIEVNPMTGVWRIPFPDLDTLCGNAPFHEYRQRRNDQRGNARGSFVLALEDTAFERVM